MANVNKLKKYHFIYKTTNLINGKFYIGMHSTSNLKDGYLGSGKRIRRAILKYGKHNFKFEILEYCDDREVLANRETEIVNEELINDTNCLNLKLGGEGWNPNASYWGKIANAKSQIRQKLLWDTDIEWRYRRILNLQKMQIASSIKRKELGICISNYSWLGKKHKPESIEKMKLNKIGYGIGNKNSQFGTCWITNGKENKKIKKSNLHLYIDWKLGRTLKNLK